MPTLRRAPIAALILAASALALTAAGLAARTPSSHPEDARALLVLDKIDAADRAGLLIDALVDGEAAFLVILDRQADLRAASGLSGKTAKGRFVFDALRTVAADAQPALIESLRARGATVQPFIIVNALSVRGDLNALWAAAAFEGTARIVADRPYRADLPAPDAPFHPSPFILQSSSIDWGVNAVHAPKVWAMGYTGAGIVVGGQDTGVLWDHDALKNAYRGWDGAGADHNFNWHDAIHATTGNICGVDAAAPCDDNGHGTHTVGTIVGDDGAGNQIGVAPGAQWMACRNMDNGFGAPSTYLECFEWFLAPYPITGTVANGDPSKAPHVVSNSWSCPDYEGCLSGQEIISGVQAMRAAGILTVVAATNAGPDCSTIGDPPAIHAEAFTVGAHDGNGNIASFSSRGPVLRDGSGRLKPDLAAPGVSVRSATRSAANSYSTLSGTSMATPHVAGAAALLWDAAPYLIGQVDLTEWVLRLSAAPSFTTQGCGGDAPTARPNNVWGWGQLDALAAVSATFSLTPTAALRHLVLAPDWVILDASMSTDPETPSDALLLRWDFENDGVWDTPWSFNSVITGSQATIGPVAAVQVADSGGRTDASVAGAIVLNEKLYLPLAITSQ